MNEIETASYFESEFNELAQQEVACILEKVEEEKQKAICFLEKDLEAKAKVQIEHEKNDAVAQMSMEKAQLNTEKNKKLVAKREQMVDAIFDRVKTDIEKFMDSRDYQTFIKNKIADVEKQVDMSDCVILMKDDQMEKELSSYTVQISKDIKIGGFIVETKQGLVVDETFDTALTSQRQWFYDNSKLIIK